MLGFICLSTGVALGDSWISPEDFVVCKIVSETEMLCQVKFLVFLSILDSWTCSCHGDHYLRTSHGSMATDWIAQTGLENAAFEAKV